MAEWEARGLTLREYCKLTKDVKFPSFINYHEAYAKLTEVIEELVENTEEIVGNSKTHGWLEMVWRNVRSSKYQSSLDSDNIKDFKENLEQLKGCAVEAARDAIRISAMCDNWQNLIDSQGEVETER